MELPFTRIMPFEKPGNHPAECWQCKRAFRKGDRMLQFLNNSGYGERRTLFCDIRCIVDSLNETLK